MAVRFGGYKVNFSKVKDTTLGEVFGSELEMTPAQMTKRIWEFIKKHNLGGK
jgi:chromatin remodeling complex protein RSC6